MAGKRAARAQEDQDGSSPGDAWLGALAQQIGVSRIARVTGLDRGGVEVACAVRPGGHALQVSNGKGLDARQAKAGALLEAAELWAAERPSPSQLVFATLEELESRGLAVWPLEHSLSAPELFSPALRIAWLPVHPLQAAPGAGPDDHRHDFVFAPAAAVHCVPASGPWLGPAVHRWTSNGMGAHPDGELALRHALLEAAERDGLARALPEGWTRTALKTRKLERASLAGGAPKTAALVERLAAQGLAAHLFDLRPEAKRGAGRGAKMNPDSGTESRGGRAGSGSARSADGWMGGLMLAGALLIDEEDGPIPLAAGYACAASADEALLGALLEAAQSRLTDVHGAREDIAPADRDAMQGLAQAAARAKGAIDARDLPAGKPLPSGQLVARFHAAGFTEVAALDLAPPDCAARIVKVIAPGLLLSELL